MRQHHRLTKRLWQGSIGRMSIAFKTAERLSDHAWCMAAGIRDSLRTAQFYVRDLRNVDGQGAAFPRRSTLLSRLVAGIARVVDDVMTTGGNLSIRLLLPNWRKMPSPFTAGFMDEVQNAITLNKLVENPIFNAYFFRSCQNILAHWAEPPYLVLEHRIDAARREMAAKSNSRNKLEFLSETLLVLVDAAPIARYGTLRNSGKYLGEGDLNVAVCATACLALLLAEEGGAIKGIGDDEFFAIVGALLLPRLTSMQAAVNASAVNDLANELAAIRDQY
jgi:hypothetical protein